jgi:hypothetical protein
VIESPVVGGGVNNQGLNFFDDRTWFNLKFWSLMRWGGVLRLKKEIPDQAHTELMRLKFLSQIP